MKRLGIVSAAIISVVMLATSAFAQDLNKGWDAYEAGDYATALQEFRPLAGQGNAYAQTNLGFMYESGQGVPQDYAEAVKWYRLAAEQGNALGQTNLGVMHEKGKGVPQGLCRGCGVVPTSCRARPCISANQSWGYVR